MLFPSLTWKSKESTAPKRGGLVLSCCCEINVMGGRFTDSLLADLWGRSEARKER